MRLKILVLALVFPFLSIAQTDTTGRRPDFAKMTYSDIKWTKSKGSSFWFYYKPTQYFFRNTEFQTITLENGDVLVFIFEARIYLLLPAYINTQKNKEKDVEFVTGRSCVFIRSSRAGFLIYDNGLYVSELERVGVNNIHQYLYRSRVSDKRYWIEESDFRFGPLSTPIGILSE